MKLCMERRSSCSFFERTGLICRHIFHICFIKNETTAERLCIADRWRKSFENITPHFKFTNSSRIYEKQKNLEESLEVLATKPIEISTIKEDFDSNIEDDK